MDTKTWLERVRIADLKPHPRNYRTHPEDQIEHLITSLEENGVYRNIVISRDNTILAGHGVVEAAQRIGREEIEAHRLDLDSDDPGALKVLAGDNEVDHLGVVDDRALTEILKEINDIDGLLGTGYDEQMLANLAYITRPASEIRDHDAAAHWVGMPEYDNGESLKVQLTISFLNEADRERFARSINLRIDKKQRETWTTRWPFTERDDVASVRFEG